jgi:GT2 family glycosyltransferase
MKNSQGKNDTLFEPKVAIVIVNWNGKEDTFECLESIRTIDYSNVEVIVVDNGSNDNSVDEIRERFHEVVLLEAKKNLGKAGGSNIGIRYALNSGADFVLLFDNDAIADSQLIVNFLKATNVVDSHAILAAKIYHFDEPNKIWYSGTKWNNQGFKHLGMGYVDDGQRFNSIAETAYACGCALFVDKTVLKKIGILDERFFCYFEETDFCYRAKAEGFRSFVVPSAKVWHKVSSSSGGKGSLIFHYFKNRNVLLFAEKNLPLSDKLKLYNHLFKEILRAVRPPGIGTVAADERNRLRGTFEVLRSYKEVCRRKYRDPVRKAKLRGVCDYLLRRFGDRSESIKSIGK